MSVVDGNKITIPVSVADVATVLGASSLDVGTLCTHPNINMWAKYKPVPLRNIVGLPDELDGNDGWKGNPIAGTNRPWWFGGGQSTGSSWWTYDIPIISELSDIGSDGVQNNDSAWKYRKPWGKSETTGGDIPCPYRLTDFVGYKHDARPPFVPRMPDKLHLGDNYYNSFGLSANDDPDDNEFTIDDVKNMLGVSKLYLGISIRNVSRGTQASAVNPRELYIGDDDSWWFNLHQREGYTDTILNGGFGVSIGTNDRINIWLFLTTSVGETAIDYMTKYSALLDDSYKVYSAYTGDDIDEPIITVNGTYGYTDFDHNHLVGSTTRLTKNEYYSTDGVNVYAYDGRINNGQAEVWAQVQNSATGNFRVYLRQYGYLPSGARFNFPRLLLYSASNVRLSSKYTVDLNSHTNQMQYTAYTTYEDAYSQDNGATVAGSLPLFSEVLANDYGDGETGKITGRRAYIEVEFLLPGIALKWTKQEGGEVDVDGLLNP